MVFLLCCAFAQIFGKSNILFVVIKRHVFFSEILLYPLLHKSVEEQYINLLFNVQMIQDGVCDSDMTAVSGVEVVGIPIDVLKAACR